tara:strand:+ start:307 stop:558 length:252 start_codon:yes stop_codon:yes gene_type:complete
MDLFTSLSDKTEILESLNWDEDALVQLISFIDMQKECFIPTHPSEILNQVEEHFGNPARVVLEKIMKREYSVIVDKGKNNYEN